nr:WG repeat-containing protein [Chitinophagaceae bacterium]
MKKIIVFSIVLLTLQSSMYAQNAIPIYFSKLGAYVFADKITKQPIKPVIQFKNIQYLGFGFWAVDNGSSSLNNRQALFDYKGKQLTDFKYSYIHRMYEKSPILKFEEDEKFGLIDSFGKELFAAKYQFIDINPSEGLHKVRMNNKIGFVNNQGKELISCKYNRINDFSDGLALVDETKEGEEFKSVYFIDKTGKIALKPSVNNIENIGNFSEGLAAIDCYWKTNNYGLYGFIDKKGNMVIEPQFTSIFPTENAFKN